MSNDIHIIVKEDVTVVENRSGNVKDRIRLEIQDPQGENPNCLMYICVMDHDGHWKKAALVDTGVTDRHSLTIKEIQEYMDTEVHQTCPTCGTEKVVVIHKCGDCGTTEAVTYFFNSLDGEIE